VLQAFPLTITFLNKNVGLFLGAEKEYQIGILVNEWSISMPITLSEKNGKIRFRKIFV